MSGRTTRSTENPELLSYSNQELGRIEREGRRNKKSAEMEAQPILQADGSYRNAAGQICDEHGQLIAPQPPVDPRALAAAGGNLPQNPQHVDRQAPGRVDRQDGREQPARADDPDNARTLAEYNRPDLFYANRSAIRLPTFQRNDFELKPAFYTLVGQHPFHGLPNEHPMDHIENFEDLASSIKANGVSSDYLYCKLFPHSLGGEASAWLKNLEPGSLTTWEETKNAFLCNFYDDARSEELRKKISQFAQGPAEAFKAAWVRFKSHQKACPHHGFSTVQLLGIFYRGIDWRHQMALDAASNGNFNTRYPAEAMKLIENLSQANSTKNADLERQKLAGNGSGKEIAEVNAKIDMVANFLMGKKSVNFADHVETIEPEQQGDEEDVNYVSGFQGQRFGNQQGNRGFNNSNGQRFGSPGYVPKSDFQKEFQRTFQHNNNTGYTRNYGNTSYQAPPPPQDAKNDVTAMFEQLLEGQQKLTVSLNGKLDNVYTTLNDRIEALNTHVKKLDVQVAQTAETVKRQEGFLPGRTDQNPKHCNAILIREGDDVWEYEESDEDEYEEDTFEDVSGILTSNLTRPRAWKHEKQAAVASASNQQIRQCVDRHTIVGVDRQTSGSQISSRRQPSAEMPTSDQCVDRHTHTTVDRHDPMKDLPYVVIPPSVQSDVYAPKVPFPKPRRSKQEIEDEKCQAMLQKIKTEISTSDDEDTSSPMKRLVRRMVLNGLTPEEGALLTRDISAIFSAQVPTKKKEKTKEVVVSEQVSAVIQNKLPAKLPDPGRFVLDCSISGERFEHSLCDLGSSVNLMPHSVAKKLGTTDFKPTNISLILADRSTRQPVGVLEDVLVQVGECTIPADFVVLDYDSEPQDPLILGRAFLATAGAIIDVKKGRMSLNVDGKTLNFNTFKPRAVAPDAPPVVLSTIATSPKTEPPKPSPSLPARKPQRSRKKPKSTKAVSMPSAKDAEPPLLSKTSNAYTPPWKLRQSAQANAQKSPDL